MGDAATPEHREFIASGTLADYRETLGLHEDQYVTPFGEWPMFNEQSGSWVEAKDTYAVVELAEEDVTATEWAAGFYLLDLPVTEVRYRLGIAQS